MIKISVFYPNKEGARFDMDYYLQKHMPMVRQKMAGAMKGMGVEQGISGGMPGAPLSYRVIAHMTFDSMEAIRRRLGRTPSRSWPTLQIIRIFSPSCRLAKSRSDSNGSRPTSSTRCYPVRHQRGGPS